MKILYIFLCSSCFLLVSSIKPDRIPTKGGVWPKPKTQTEENDYYTFDPDKFNIEVTGSNTCQILTNRIRHYIYQIKQMKQLSDKYKHSAQTETKSNKVQKVGDHVATEGANVSPGVSTGSSSDGRHLGGILALQVDLTAPCEQYPHLDMDESYSLKVTSTAKLTSASVWGIIRGLETFSQLFYFTDEFTEIRIKTTEITDSPAYKHRGLLLDTSRHYIPVKDILTTIDVMAMNKMNVFHWHIVDDQSFPYQSEKFPGLSERGAYHKTMVYTKADIKSIVEYATERGVRVVPEFDVPGHTLSWGEAFPNLLTKCYRNNKFTKLGPMDPTKESTYKMLEDFFTEVQNLFPEHYIHVGGDEVALDCWESNDEIRQWMREHGIPSTSQLHSHFMSRTLPLLQPHSDAIVWQEVFDEGVSLTKDTLIQVWQNWNSPGWHMYRALESGYRVLFSSSWYLDHLGQTFEKMLAVDPRQMVTSRNQVLLENLIGGEACMWGENVDETNLHSRVWPRASAVAERLWSGPQVERTPLTLRRAEEHVCRMKRRGVPAEPPVGPGFCLS